MDCDQTREWLSARLDGELDPAGGPAVEDDVDRHLAGCPACREWMDRASLLRRETIVRLVPSVPDLSGGILAASAPDRRPSDLASMARWGLALIAAVQVLAASSVMLASDSGPSVHIARELASWDLALALGFAVAAFRPTRARGMFPLLAVLVGCLCATSLLDMVQGYADPTTEAVHMVEIVGLGLSGLVARPPAPRNHPPAPKLRLA